VDLLNPRPESITLQDIAYHLSKIERYNGACKFSVTVGLHSLMVAEVLPVELKPYGLLHDASEAYLGDVVGPLKDLLPGYQEVEGNLMKVILEKYGLRFPVPPEVKEADKAVLAAEMRQANGWYDLAAEIGQAAPVVLYDLPQYVVFERLLRAFREFFPDTE
jgi:5'-deoxynucleotidase YfbR-like HD superfamily hydrolase